GGRSLVWGGWCIPPDRSCFAEARDQGAAWPIKFADLSPYVERVGRFLRVRAGRLHPRMVKLNKVLGIDLQPKHGSTAVGRQRPITSLDRLRRAQLRGHSVVLRVVRDEHERAAGVEVAGPSPDETEVLKARVVVLAASPVETARILHMTDPTGI